MQVLTFTHLNWQKMSAYSAEMLEACRTVTLKVKVLPIFRCDRAFSGERSRGRSRPRTELLVGVLGASTVATVFREKKRRINPIDEAIWQTSRSVRLSTHTCLTFARVVVDFIHRDPHLSILSFSLYNSQLLLGSVGVWQSARARLSLELRNEIKK